MNLYPPEYGNDPLFPKSTDFEIVTKDIDIGKGVYCYSDFKKGQIIAKMKGEIVSDLRQHTLQISENKHLYDVYFAGYFLHSCDPNISLNMQKMTVTAVQDIQANSYLFMDYSETEEILYKKFVCSCGSDKCRGLIVGKNEG